MFRLQSFPCIFEPRILTDCEVRELLSNHSCPQDLTLPTCLPDLNWRELHGPSLLCPC